MAQILSKIDSVTGRRKQVGSLDGSVADRQSFTRDLTKAGGSLSDLSGSFNVSDYRSLSGNGRTNTMSNSVGSVLDSSANALSGAIDSMGTYGDREKTIMEKFSDRRSLAQEGGKAERDLISGNALDSINSQLEENARNITNEIEGRSGYATQKVALDYVANTGKKRITDLEKQRDSLLLQSKVSEASRLDGLIADEQQSITTARKSFIDEIMNIGSEARSLAQESRTQAGFETPQQARMRDLQVSEIAAESANDRELGNIATQAVQELALSAPDAGIKSTDSYDQAIEKYRNSNTYKRNEKKAELEIDKMNANIANEWRLASGAKSGDTSGDPILDSAKSDLDIVASNAMNLIQSENGKVAFANSLKTARSDADRINAISSVVLANSPAEIKTDFINQSAGIREIDEAIKVLDQGVQTGVLQAGSQYVYNIFGNDYDPKIAAINAHITSAIQPYRSSITGAAWGAQEDGEYQQLFGSTKYSPTELRERLVRMKGILQRKSINALGSQVSPFGQYDIFSDAYGQEAGGSGGGGNKNMFEGDL